MLDLVQESSPTLTKVFTITFLRPDVPVQKFIAEFKCLLAFSLAFDTKFVSWFVMLARVTNPVMNVVTGIWVTDNRRDSVMITLGDCDLFKEKLGFNGWKKSFLTSESVVPYILTCCCCCCCCCWLQRLVQSTCRSQRAINTAALAHYTLWQHYTPHYQYLALQPKLTRFVRNENQLNMWTDFQKSK